MLAKVQSVQRRLNRLFDVEIATLATPLDSAPRLCARGVCRSAISLPTRSARLNGRRCHCQRRRSGRGSSGRHQTLEARYLDELPFGQQNMVTNVPGKALLDALETGFSDRAYAGRFPQVLGSHCCRSGAAAWGTRENGDNQREALDVSRDLPSSHQ